jgi:hypothetical protein
MKKDKVKVLDEVLNEDRIRQFLSLEPPANENADFHRLQKAYRGMPAQYFETFVKLFLEDGGDISAKSSQGKTLLDELENHKQAQAYRDILLAANT